MQGPTTDEAPAKLDANQLTLMYACSLQVLSAISAVGLVSQVLALCLLLLARLPAALRRLSYPPVLCLVIAATITCAYHQPYDMLLVAGAVIPIVLLAGDRSALMLGVFAAAGISVAVSNNAPVAAILDPVGLLVIAMLSALAARQAERPVAAVPAGPISAGLTTTVSAVADKLIS